MKKLQRNQGMRKVGENSKDNVQQEIPRPRTFSNTRQLDIPRRFQIGGLEIAVTRNDSLVEKRGMVAESVYNEQEIAMDFSHAQDSFTEQSFWHEAVHYILFVMNEDGLRNNERFVDLFGHLLYQIVKSSGFGICQHRLKDLTTEVDEVGACWRDGRVGTLGEAANSRSCERCGNGVVPYHCIQSGDELEGWTCYCDVESTGL